MTEHDQFRDNRDLQRYEWTENGLTAFAEYRRNGDSLAIPHVEAPLPLRGKGAADRLMRAVVNYARDRKLTIVPMCGYARAWFRRHAEDADVLD